MPDLPALFDAVREKPDDKRRWIAFAQWHWDNWQEDEAVGIRLNWESLRDGVTAGWSLDETLQQVARLGADVNRALREMWERESNSPG